MSGAQHAPAPGRRPVLVSLGEALVDLVPLEEGASVAAADGFAKLAGGAPANVAAGVARLGGDVRLVAKVGGDELGDYLLATLAATGVDTRWMARDAGAQTALALVSLDPTPRAAFTFYGEPAAHLQLAPGDVDETVFAGATALHLGSLTLTREPARAAGLKALEVAQTRGMLISFDPNYRASLWPSAAAAREVLAPLVGRAHLVKLSREELELLAPGAAPSALAGPATRLIVVTDGAAGADLWSFAGRSPWRAHVPAFAVDAVDPTGAGDAFVAAMLRPLLAAPEALRDDSEKGRERLSRLARRAVAYAALTTTRRGGVTAMPSERELELFLGSRPGS